MENHPSGSGNLICVIDSIEFTIMECSRPVAAIGLFVLLSFPLEASIIGINRFFISLAWGWDDEGSISFKYYSA